VQKQLNTVTQNQGQIGTQEENAKKWLNTYFMKKKKLINTKIPPPKTNSNHIIPLRSGDNKDEISLDFGV